MSRAAHAVAGGLIVVLLVAPATRARSQPAHAVRRGAVHVVVGPRRRVKLSNGQFIVDPPLRKPKVDTSVIVATVRSGPWIGTLLDEGYDARVRYVEYTDLQTPTSLPPGPARRRPRLLFDHRRVWIAQVTNVAAADAGFASSGPDTSGFTADEDFLVVYSADGKSVLAGTVYGSGS